MTGSDSAAATTAEHDVLRTLALKAKGMTGADIEYLVREARHKARRGQRALEYGDLVDILMSGTPERPQALRLRMAVHESGHAIAYLAFGLGRITAMTIDSRGGGYIEGEIPDPSEETEELASAVLVMRLAGRAAEHELLGAITAGSGGSPDSDLATATMLATRMETEFGFGTEMPLMHQPVDIRFTLFTYHPSLAERVNARLEDAYAHARDLIRDNRAAIEFLAEALMKHGMLEGSELIDVLVGVRGRMNTCAWSESGIRSDRTERD